MTIEDGEKSRGGNRKNNTNGSKYDIIMSRAKKYYLPYLEMVTRPTGRKLLEMKIIKNKPTGGFLCQIKLFAPWQNGSDTQKL